MDNLNYDALSKIAEQQEIKNIITAIEFRARYGMSEQNANLLSEIIVESAYDQDNQIDISNPFYQIAKQMAVENMLRAIAIKAKYGLSASNRDLVDNFIAEYANKTEKSIKR